MYTYIGCFEDNQSRLLPDGPHTGNNKMSANICFHHCNSKNSEYFATEYGSQCFCGNGRKLGTDSIKNKTDCNMKCNGHVEQKCGGYWRASVYQINNNGHRVSTTSDTPTSYQLSTTKYTPTSPKPSNSDIIGIGVGISIVLLLIIVAVISCLFWKRRKQMAHLKESSMIDHEYDRNQNKTSSDSSSIGLNVYENGHAYGNSNSNNTSRISNGYIEPQICNTTAKHMNNKSGSGHAHDKLNKRSILKNMLPSMLHNYFKLDNDKTDKEDGNHIADISQTELDLTAGGSNGAYATLDSTETGFNKGKRVFLRNKQNMDQTKLVKTNHVTKGEGDYCCVEGEYNTLNKVRRFSNHDSLYSHAVDGVYDITGNNNQSKITDINYDHFTGNQTVIAADYDNVIKY